MRADLENNTNFKRIGLTLKIKVNRQSQVTELGFGFSEFHDIENVRIDTKIESIACTQQEISKIIGKLCMIFKFQCQTFEIHKLFQHFLYPRPLKC